MKIARTGRFTIHAWAKRRGSTWVGVARITPPLYPASPLQGDETIVHAVLKPSASRAEDAALQTATQMLQDTLGVELKLREVKGD